MHNIVIDAHPPSVVAAAIHHTSSSPARIGTNITVALVANEPSLLAGYGTVLLLALRGIWS